MSPSPTSSPTRLLRNLCLGGLALGPANANAGQDVPRCVPEPPSTTVSVLGGEVEAPPGPVAALAIDDAGAQWVFSADGAAWRRHGGPWSAQPIATEAQVTDADAGEAVWVVGTEGSVWSHEGPDGWRRHALPDGARPDLQHVTVEGRKVVVGGRDGSLHLSEDRGKSWVALGGGAPIAALDIAKATVVAARTDGTLDWHDKTTGAWRTEVRPLPEGREVGQLLVRSLDQVVVLDTAGDLWASLDRGVRWESDRGDHHDDPLRLLVSSPLGPLLVHRSGQGGVLAWSGRRPEISPVASWVALPGIVTGVGVAEGSVVQGGVVQGGAARPSVLAVDEQGRLAQQRFQIRHMGGHPCGRPLEVDGRSVTAAVGQGSGWSAPLAPVALPAASRAALAELWQQDAVAEHASIGSFARFVLQLMALGAPAELVDEAQRAMGDEVRHAQQCFTLASRYAGRPLRPEMLPLDGVLDGEVDLVSVSVDVLREGAVGETIGALLAAERWQRATDPAVRAALATIAEDEGLHARSAWRFLAWAVAEGGSPVREALRDALEDAVASHDVGRAEGPTVPGWSEHGGLTAAETRRVVRRAVRGVVGPCMDALLASQPTEPGEPRRPHAS